jgi:hypothetical protein
MTAALAAGVLAGGWACNRATTEKEENLPLSSVVAVAAPNAQRQLVSGFWGVENNAWRWTKHNFVVLLMPPPGAAQNGATLELRLAVMDSVIARRQSVTLTATVGDTALPPETYTESGNFLYKRDVPAAAFAAGSSVKVAFSTDNFLRAGEVEGRELALVVHSAGLLAK